MMVMVLSTMTQRVKRVKPVEVILKNVLYFFFFSVFCAYLLQTTKPPSPTLNNASIKIHWARRSSRHTYATRYTPHLSWMQGSHRRRRCQPLQQGCLVYPV